MDSLFPAEIVERWIPVIGYEGAYEVSDLGRVRSIDRIITKITRWGNPVASRHKGRILLPTIDKGKFAYGRLQVKLSKPEGATTRLVHHLVAEAFIGPRPSGMEVAHGDGIASNCRLGNLRYATPKENSADKETHGTLLRGSAVGTAKLTESDVVFIISMRRKRTLQSIADEFGISIAQVSRIQNGSRWGHLR